MQSTIDLKVCSHPDNSRQDKTITRQHQKSKLDQKKTRQEITRQENQDQKLDKTRQHNTAQHSTKDREDKRREDNAAQDQHNTTPLFFAVLIFNMQ
jgi:hypothetical protein